MLPGSLIWRKGATFLTLSRVSHPTVLSQKAQITLSRQYSTYSSATQHEVWWKYLNTYSVPFARDPSGSKGLRNEAAELMAKIQLNQHANHFNLPSCTIAQRIAALHNMHCNYCCESQSSLATEMPKRRTFQLEKWLPKNHHTFSKSW